MTDAAVTIASVSKAFPGARQPALAGVSLEIRRNEFFTLLGPSGCGKTTLLRMIAGFEHPDSGTIHLDGSNLAGTPPNLRPVNTVFQSYALFPHMSVAGNIAFGLEMIGRPRPAIRDRVAEMLSLLKLDGLGDRKPSQLSGGQQQRVALGRALAPSPKVLLLDEPLSALDLKLRKEMQIELKRLQAETGITFVFVTHDQEEALTMSDHIAVMRDGAVMQIGHPLGVYERPANLFVAEFIGEANFWQATCVERDGPAGRFAIAGGSSDSIVTVTDANDVGLGEDATLVVRPERISVATDRAATLGGHVESVVYQGSDLMLRAALAGGMLLKARLPATTDGSQLLKRKLEFNIPSEAVRVFAR